MPFETNVLDNIHLDFNNFSISSVKNDLNILIGRPYGGLSILCRKELNIIGNITFLDDDRLLAFMINLDNVKYLFVNLYLPYFCDENLADYTMYMGKLENIIEEHEVNAIALIGDFNAEPNNEYYRLMLNLCDEYDLTVSDVSLLSPDSYTCTHQQCFAESFMARPLRDVAIAA